MFSLYRRHEEDCQHSAKGVRHTRCSCPIWMDGYDQKGKRQRRSLKTRDWRHAQQVLDRIESGTPLPRDLSDSSPTVKDAIASYLADCKVRKLAPGTLVSYATFLNHVEGYFPGARLSAIEVEPLSKFRGARTVSASSQVKELGYLRAFFGFCHDRKWIQENYAKRLKNPRYDLMPTLPFTDEEVQRLLEACERIDNPNKREIPRARLRARALVLVLLYSGLRISDAIKLERSAVDLKTGRLRIRMMKTRQPMTLNLQERALIALRALPVESKYFFWSGTSKLSTAVGSARRTVDCVVKLADVADGHPHRFRDTFAVGLLLAGEELRTVQLLLGHTSIKTTEKHYAPFVTAMQRRLDDAVGKLHFGLPAQLHMDALDDTNGNPKSNVRPFPSKASRARAYLQNARLIAENFTHRTRG